MKSASAAEELPDFGLKVDGSAVGQAVAGEVRSVEVTEEIGRLARAVIQLRDWDAENNRADATVEAAFPVGAKIEVSMGYGGQPENVFSGLVVSARIRCRDGDLPELEVQARCHGVKLLGGPRYRVWTGNSDLAAVSDLAGELGIDVSGTDGFPHALLVQHRTTDWDFVQRRARALGRVAYVRGRSASSPVLYFAEPSSTGSPVATYRFGEDLIDLELSRDVTTATGDVTTVAWDSESQEVRQAQRSLSQARLPDAAQGGLSAMLGKADLNKPRARSERTSVAAEQAELDAWGQGLVDAAQASSSYGRITVAGDPKLRIDSLVAVDGLSEHYDGSFYASGVTHRITPGRYVTTVAFGTPPAAVSRPEADARPMEKVDELLIAIVESFEDADKSQARVQLRLPWMGADDAPVWARLAMPSAGSGSGLVLVPEPGDEVLVLCVDGDPRHPVVVGSLWNGKSAPPDGYDAEKNDRRAFYSRSGHSIVFDDGEDQPGIRLVSAAGQEVVVDDAAGSESIRLMDKTGNEVRMDSEGIALTAASGKKIALSASGGQIELSADKVSVQATTDVGLNAGSKLSGVAASELQLSGAQVAVQGSAQCTVQAPMIKLN